MMLPSVYIRVHQRRVSFGHRLTQINADKKFQLALSVTALFFGVATLLAQESRKTDLRWAPLAFLIGEWVGEGGGGPGQGTGEFSFQLDLGGAILIRRNVSDYPATKDKPAYSHTDLMIIDSTLRANYFDDEGHTIHYTVEPSANGNGVQFLSEAASSHRATGLPIPKPGTMALPSDLR